MSFTGQGHRKIGQWEGLVQRGVVYKYQVNPIMNNKVMANVKFLDALTFEFKGQCHQKICPWEGVVQRRVVYKYQVNLFCSMEVMAKV